uniref:Uncharacterized protein n=1 Tax=Anguilla anguilla TaxID=7936 RepID=A0A0E9TEN0_ANGAN
MISQVSVFELQKGSEMKIKMYKEETSWGRCSGKLITASIIYSKAKFRSYT